MRKVEGDFEGLYSSLGSAFASSMINAEIKKESVISGERIVAWISLCGLYLFIVHLKNMFIVHLKKLDWDMFDICIYLWNHHHNLDSEHTLSPTSKFSLARLGISSSHPYLILGNHWSAFCHNWLVCINEIIWYILLGRESGFFQHNYFEIYL